MDEAQSDWHASETTAVADRLGVSFDGLSSQEALERQSRYGLNRLTPPKKQSALMRFLMQFHNLLIYVLLASGVVTIFLGHFVDSSVIFGVVVINAIIGFIQEGKAEKALEAIRNMLSAQAMVQRDGARGLIEAENLVPGDVVVLQSGDKVPADLRILEVKGLRVQEAVLTGESLDVEKTPAPVAANAPLGDRTSMAYSGTLITAGRGVGLVVETGDATEIGRISSMIASVETLTTPLLRQMAIFAQWLTGGILLIAAMTMAYGVWVRDYTVTDMFLAAVGLAVAAIPEGLPAIMTITLAIGVQRMAGRNAIIRRLPAVETLGSVTVICSDKTGTLTRNEMTVRTVVTADHLFTVTGDGYQPHGDFQINGGTVSLDNHPLLTSMTHAALTCTDARLKEKKGQWEVHGNPTEGALIALAMKAGFDPVFEAQALPRTDVIPFESEHKFMATLHHDHDGQGHVFVKGAPERLIAMCREQFNILGAAPIDADYWRVAAEDIAAKGQRVLAIAIKRATDGQTELTFGDVESGLSLLGLFGIDDPPRSEAITSIAACRAAGVQVKMITGDHAATAAAIGAELGLDGTGATMTGAEIDSLDDAALKDKVKDINIFARTNPEHKLRLVKALQERGNIVSMTGDGVNDAPALKRADVGVAMGRKGTEAAKEAAEMVLADDNFASIANAVEEGRTVYDNIKKAILFILPTNGAEGLSVIAAIVLGITLPITPVQILWVNMITAVTLGLALAFEAGEENVMSRPPRRSDEPLLSGFLSWRILYVAVICVVGVFGLYLWEHSHGASVNEARTVAVNTLVMFEVFYLFCARYLIDSILTPEGLLGSRPVLIAAILVTMFQVVFTYTPPFQFLFETENIDGMQWVRILVVSFMVIPMVEAEKLILRLFARRAGV